MYARVRKSAEMQLVKRLASEPNFWSRLLLQPSEKSLLPDDELVVGSSVRGITHGLVKLVDGGPLCWIRAEACRQHVSYFCRALLRYPARMSALHARLYLEPTMQSNAGYHRAPGVDGSINLDCLLLYAMMESCVLPISAS